jgi:hypothetical protein
VRWHPDPVWLTIEQFQTELRERSRTTLFEQEWSELSRATKWLQDFMRDGALCFKLIKDTADFNGIASITLRRAFRGMKGISWRAPGTNTWYWQLPQKAVNLRFPRWIEEQEQR